MGHIYCNFYEDDVITAMPVTALFCPFFQDLPSVITPLRVTSTRKMSTFSTETCLKVTHRCFIFQNLFKHWLTHVSQTKDSTAAIVALVVETTLRPGLF